jgi:hypothetical protein
MTDNAKGFLEVGLNDGGEIVVNHPDLKPDADGVGHIVFSPSQARNFAELLLKHASQSERDRIERETAARRKAAEAIPVDRDARVLTDGSPVTDDHRELLPSGQQKGYIVLTESERAKGFVRPFRNAYRHATCGKIMTMSREIAETYARDPALYSGTFCTTCRGHFPVGEGGEFTWYEMDGREGPKVGT